MRTRLSPPSAAQSALGVAPSTSSDQAGNSPVFVHGLPTPNRHGAGAPGLRIQRSGTRALRMGLFAAFSALLMAHTPAGAEPTSAQSSPDTSAPAAEATRFDVSGQVHTEGGDPQAGVEVLWLDLRTGGGEAVRTTTDTDGRFTLSVPRGGRVWVADGATPHAVHVDAERSDLSFVVPNTCPSRLRVVDGSGSPVAAYQMELSSRGVNGLGVPARKSLGSFTSNQSGWVELPQLTCVPLTVNRGAPLQPPVTQSRLDPTLDGELEVVVEEGPLLHGRVETEEGAPIGGVELLVQAGRDTVSLTTDDQGVFDVQVPAETGVHIGLISRDWHNQSLTLHSPARSDWETTWVVQTPRVVMVDCGDPERCESIGYAACESEDPNTDQRYGNCWWDGDSALRCTCPEGEVRITSQQFGHRRVPSGGDTIDLDDPPIPVFEGESVTVSVPVEHEVELDEFCSIEWKSPAAHNTVSCAEPGMVDLTVPANTTLELTLRSHHRQQTRRLAVGGNGETVRAMGTIGTGSFSISLEEENTGKPVVEAWVSIRGIEGTAAGIFAPLNSEVLPGGTARFLDLPAGTWQVRILSENGKAEMELELQPGEHLQREVLLPSTTP